MFYRNLKMGDFKTDDEEALNVVTSKKPFRGGWGIGGTKNDPKTSQGLTYAEYLIVLTGMNIVWASAEEVRDDFPRLTNQTYLDGLNR